MRSVRWNVSAGAVLLFALLYFFDGDGLVSALLPAALAHELGHAAALRCCGSRVRRVSVGVFGVEMDYAGTLSGLPALLSLAAGPAAGFIYAFAACRAESDFWRLSGALSFCLSVFNLLPVLPLDGGRIAEELGGERLAGSLSRAAAAVLALTGLWVLWRYRVGGPAAMGIWLCVYNFRGEGNGAFSHVSARISRSRPQRSGARPPRRW